MLVYVFNFNLIEFSAAILEKGLLDTALKSATISISEAFYTGGVTGRKMDQMRQIKDPMMISVLFLRSIQLLNKTRRS